MRYSVDRVNAGPVNLDKTIIDFPGEKLIFRFYPLGKQAAVPPTEKPLLCCPWFSIASVPKTVPETPAQTAATAE